MDNDVKETNGLNNKPLLAEETSVVENNIIDDGEDYSESNSLLPPRRGGMSKNCDKVRRKVQWNDNNGNKLVEILEFEPSDVSDSDEEDSDSCICIIM